MFCWNCGTELEDGSQYCYNCGEAQQSTSGDGAQTYSDDARQIDDGNNAETTIAGSGDYYFDDEDEIAESGQTAVDAGYGTETVRNESRPDDSAQTVKQDNVKMMYCNYCGTAMEATETYCYNCNRTVEEAPKASNKVVLGPWTVTKGQYEEIKKRDKAIKWFAHGAMIFCALLILKPILFKPTVNVTPYVSVHYEGYNGYGSAYVEFDDEKFNEAYKFKFNCYSTDKSNMFSFVGRRHSFFDMDDDYSYRGTKPSTVLHACGGELTQSENLKNGDTITYEWNISEDYILENYGFIVKSKPVKFTVSGLEELRPYDPFDDFDMKFSGMNGYGEAYWDYDTDKTYEYGTYYEVYDQSYNLKNGDEIRVFYDSYYGDDVTERLARGYGIQLTTTYKTYKVDGLADGIE